MTKNKKTQNKLLKEILKEKVLLMPNKKYSDEENNIIVGANDTIKQITIPITISKTKEKILKLLAKAKKKDAWGYYVIEADWDGLKKEIEKI